MAKIPRKFTSINAFTYNSIIHLRNKICRNLRDKQPFKENFQVLITEKMKCKKLINYNKRTRDDFLQTKKKKTI